MNEDLSIATGIAREPDVDLSNPTAATDAGESVPVDIKHLSADPKSIARFKKQLTLPKQSKEEGESIGEFSTDESTGKNHTLCGAHKSRRESVFLKLLPRDKEKIQPFPAKPAVKFDIKSPISPSQMSKNTNGATTTSEPQTAEPGIFCKALKNTETTPREFSLQNNTIPTTRTNNIYGTEKTSQSTSEYLQTLPKPVTLLRGRFETAASTPNGSKITSHAPGLNTEINDPKVVRTDFKDGETAPVITPHGLYAKTSSSGKAQSEIGRLSNIKATCSTYPSSLETVKNASGMAFASETKKSEHPHSPESTSDMHKTAVLETIPFLRTPAETTAPVSDPTVAQQTQKSHAMLLTQQICDHIIDRILVSSSALNDNRTVTVQLSPQLLQDTEVQFTQNGTSLDIRLVSQNKDSIQFLQQHQSDLQTYLQGELKTYRAISVRVPSSQTTSDLAQPHDGRSRNRFGYQPTDEEETT